MGRHVPLNSVCVCVSPAASGGSNVINIPQDHILYIPYVRHLYWMVVTNHFCCTYCACLRLLLLFWHLHKTGWDLGSDYLFGVLISFWENWSQSSSDPDQWLAPVLRPVLWLRDHRAAGRALSSLYEGKSIPDLIRPQHIPFITTPERAPVLMLVTVHFREHLLPDPSTLGNTAAESRVAELLNFFFFTFHFLFFRTGKQRALAQPRIPLHQQLVRINRRWEEEDGGGAGGEWIRNVQQHWCQCKHIPSEINRAVLKLILAANERTVPGSLMEQLHVTSLTGRPGVEVRGCGQGHLVTGLLFLITAFSNANSKRLGYF